MGIMKSKYIEHLMQEEYEEFEPMYEVVIDNELVYLGYIEQCKEFVETNGFEDIAVIYRHGYEKGLV